MTPKQLVNLALAAAVAAAAAIFTYVSAVPWQADATAVREPLMPALATKGETLAAIEISRGDNRVKLSATDGQWRLDTGEGYPADNTKVRTLILAASEAALVERKTARKDRHELLGLIDPQDKESSARLLRFLDAGGAVLGEAILGRPAEAAATASKGATYVRRPGTDQAWVADRDLSASLSLRDWVETKLIDISPSDVKALRIEIAGDTAYDIKPTADGKNHELTAMPSGKKLKYVNSVDEIVEAASLIEFKKVRKAGKADALPVKGRAILETSTGQKPSVEFRSDGKEAWIRILAEGAEVPGLKARTEGWEFEVPMSEINSVLIKLSDLLEDAPA